VVVVLVVVCWWILSLFEIGVIMDDLEFSSMVCSLRSDIDSLVTMVNALTERLLELEGRVNAIEHLVRRLERKAELD